MPAHARIERPTRQLVSREQIVAAALAVIDEQGLSNCTLGAVAERLGVRAPSLYHHVAGRADLLRDVARLLFTTFPLPRIEEATDWREEIVRVSRETWRSILRHPNTAPLLLDLPPRAILAEAYAHWGRLLEAKGVSAAQRRLIVDGMDTLTFGAALFAAAGRRRQLDEGAAAAAVGERAELDAFVDTVRCYLRGVTND